MTAEQDLSWILENFVKDVPGVVHTQTVSSDGIHLASSSGMTEVQQEQFAAVTSGLSSLNESAGETFGILPAIRQVLEFQTGWILVSRISASANLAVICDKSADLGLVGYEMAVLAERCGELLSPEVISRLKNMLAI
ncbi:MAG: roadblock/LC7 domain-containing protein [Acidimicrobiales bacterium]